MLTARSHGESFTEVKSLLLARGYRPGCVDTAIQKARVISRAEALKRVTREKTTQRSVFAVAYDPRLLSIAKVVQNTGGQ